MQGHLVTFLPQSACTGQISCRCEGSLPCDRHANEPLELGAKACEGSLR